MKKVLFSLAIILVFSQEAFAQLKPPTVTKKDTLMVISCFYNSVALSRDDYPCKFIEETPTDFYVSTYRYNKGKLTYSDINKYDDTWDGHIDTYIFRDASCNGQTSSIVIVNPREDCDFRYSKIVIDNYEFFIKDINALLVETNQRRAEQGQAPVDKKLLFYTYTTY